MTPLDKEVAEWMESLGFVKEEFYWHKDMFEVDDLEISDDEATFFYRAAHPEPVSHGLDLDDQMYFILENLKPMYENLGLTEDNAKVLRKAIRNEMVSFVHQDRQRILDRVEEERSLAYREIEEIKEMLLDNEVLSPNDQKFVTDAINKKLGHWLPKGHKDYWKTHCVGCGLWLHGEPEQEGYCQCE